MLGGGMIISRTPFRVSLFGGGTDYPDWIREHGGAVLGMAINKYCYLTVRSLPPFFEHKHRIVYSKIEQVRETSEIVHPAVRAVFSELAVDDGLAADVAVCRLVAGVSLDQFRHDLAVSV